MSWRRGFWRLWLVASVLWLIVVVAIAFGESTYHPPVYVHYSDDGTTPIATSPYSTEGRALDELKSRGIVNAVEIISLPEVTAFVKPEWTDDNKRGRLEGIVRFVDDARSKREWDHLWSMVATVFFVGIGVPAAMLVLGIAIGWVSSGFRQP